VIQIVWIFVVRPDCASEFLKHYDKDGSWAKLFSQSAGYKGTSLLRDLSQKNRFILFDTWDQLSSFENFKKMHSEAYRQLDKECEALTIEETRVGIFQKNHL
jgi:heme-degrading monooxygenase HmoA